MIPEYSADSASSGTRRWGAAAKLLAIVVLAVGLMILVGVFGGGERLRALVEQARSLGPACVRRREGRGDDSRSIQRRPAESGVGRALRAHRRCLLLVFGDVIGGSVCFLAARYVVEHRGAPHGG